MGNRPHPCSIPSSRDVIRSLQSLRQDQLEAIRLPRGALLDPDHGRVRATAGLCDLYAGIIHDKRRLCARAVSCVANEEVLIRRSVENDGSTVVAAIRIHRGHLNGAVGVDLRHRSLKR